MISADSSSSSAAEVLVFPDAQSACLAAAAWLAEVIERARRDRGHAVLGLPTGSTPKAVYAGSNATAMKHSHSPTSPRTTWMNTTQ